MADWREETRRAAQRYGLDPNIFERQIGVESINFSPSVISGRQSSPAGAQGIAQIMPATAKDWGVNPLDPRAALNAAAKHMAQYVKQYGSVRDALIAYNWGPGNVGRKDLPAETRGYISRILGQGDRGNPTLHYANTQTPSINPSAPSSPVNALTGGGDPGPSTDATALIQLAAQQRQPVTSGQLPTPAALPDMYKSLGSTQGPGPKRQDVGALINAARTPGQAAANVAAQNSPLVADASTPASPTQTPRTGTGGASAALQWAESKVGFKETGTNSGGLASYLNQRFGMSNQPWCAMFTSAAVTKGGAPSSARTASVAEVRRQAQAGGGGYRKGFINPNQAKAGDLILWGNDHIAMVQRVSKGKVYYVGGNQSNGVTEASTAVGNGDIVRPLYGAR